MTDKIKNRRKKKLLVNLSVFLLLLSVVLACKLSLNNDETRRNVETETIQENSNAGNVNRKNGKTPKNQIADDPDNPRVEICKKYESCDCQTYESCMSDLKNDSTPDEPGILECIRNSSCESLCAGKPDGCPRRKTETAPQRSNCSQIRCSRDSDCPGDCHGGCSGGVCYMF